MSSTEKMVYVVVSNTDLTEGRGYPVIVAVCEIEATAHRLAEKRGVMGSPANVEKFTARLDSGWWYGPIQIVKPTDDDKKIQKLIDERDSAIRKAKAAGLSDMDIAAIAGGKP